MESAFGIEHGEIAKGLPSAVKAGGGGAFGALRREANVQGKFASTHRALQRTKKPGWTTHQYIAGTATNSGRNASASAKKLVGGGKGSIARIGSKPGKTPGNYGELFGRGPSGYSGRAKPYSRSA
jgi:hypothetical protein